MFGDDDAELGENAPIREADLLKQKAAVSNSHRTRATHPRECDARATTIDVRARGVAVGGGDPGPRC